MCIARVRVDDARGPDGVEIRHLHPLFRVCSHVFCLFDCFALMRTRSKGHYLDIRLVAYQCLLRICFKTDQEYPTRDGTAPLLDIANCRALELLLAALEDVTEQPRLKYKVRAETRSLQCLLPFLSHFMGNGVHWNVDGDGHRYHDSERGDKYRRPPASGPFQR